MSYPAASEAGPLRLGALYGAANFGSIDIDWWAGEVTLCVRQRRTMRWRWLRHCGQTMICHDRIPAALSD